MSTLISTVRALLVDFCFLMGVAGLAILLLYVGFQAGRWYLRSRWLPGEHARLAAWTKAVAELLEVTEQRAEDHITRTIERWAGSYDQFWLVAARSTYDLCATATEEELRAWRKYARRLQQNGVSPLRFAFDLAIHSAQRRGEDAARVRDSFPYRMIENAHLTTWDGARARYGSHLMRGSHDPRWGPAE